MESISIILAALTLLIVLLLSRLRKRHRLPPGPAGLPIIGNLHQIDISNFHYYLWNLSKRYGPLMTLHIGPNPAIVISSANLAKEILKTNDLIFCSRPTLLGQRKMSYNFSDVALCPYNDYWREMRKICTLHLFSAKRVASFRWVREGEVSGMVDRIKALCRASKEPVVVNLSETLTALTSSIICRVAFGKSFESGAKTMGFDKIMAEFQFVLARFYLADLFPIIGWVDKLTGKIARLEKSFKEMDDFYQELIDEHLKPERRQNNSTGHDHEDIIDILLKIKEENSSPIKLTFDHIKALVMNILLGGTETSAGTVVWAMTLLIKNPKTLKKVQEEVREVIGKKGIVEEEDISKMIYLKAVVKEAMRLHPILPLLIPRESMAKAMINGYQIPERTLVYVNSWAISRDPDCWEEPEKFMPERFMHMQGDETIIDYRATDFEMLPFGAGRRICPGMTMGIANVDLAISNLLYAFDWELPHGMSEDDIDTLTTPGNTMHKKNALRLVAKIYHHVDL